MYNVYSLEIVALISQHTVDTIVVKAESNLALYVLVKMFLFPH